MAEDTMRTEAITISPAIFDVLRNAGLLTGDAPPPPPPTPPRAVGDRVAFFPTLVAKTVRTQPDVLTQFTLWQTGGQFELDFPPNDASYIPELDRVLTAALTDTLRGQGVVQVDTEITKVISSNHWSAELRGLWVYSTLPAPTTQPTRTIA